MQVLPSWIDRKDDQTTDDKTLSQRGMMVKHEWAWVGYKLTDLARGVEWVSVGERERGE